MTASLKGWQRGIGYRLPWIGSQEQPEPLTQPRWVGWSTELAAELGMVKDPELLTWLAGGASPLEWQPVAQIYSGHQFGGYTPRLGDGRGLHLGERNGLEIFVKGSGVTPYSRGGDGRAVLRSALREFLASEALHHLGIATTRALAVIGSETPVEREAPETGAIMVRGSRSHLRFGHFEYFYYTEQHHRLGELIEDCIHHHFPEHRDDWAGWLEAVVRRTAETMADWQAFGFCHGVLNSDNMSILGETFDFGPYAFLDRFDPGFVCNHSDHIGRYAYDQQPGIGLWNLHRLAVSLTPFLSEQQLQSALRLYEPTLIERYHRRMAARLGLLGRQAEDFELFADLMQLMQKADADYTNALRSFTELEPGYDDSPLHRRLASTQGWQSWYQRYVDRVGRIEALEPWQAERRAANPALILRTHLAHQAIVAAEQGNNLPLERLHQALKQPYDPPKEYLHYGDEPPQWSRQLILSCSS